MIQSNGPIFILLILLNHGSSFPNICNNGGWDSCQPEQIHISYGDDPTEMVVTWSTTSMPEDDLATVRFSKDVNLKTNDMRTVKGTITEFTDFYDEDYEEMSRQYVGRAHLSGLTPGETYYYQVKVVDIQRRKCKSPVLSFIAMNEGQSWVPRLAVFGDFGLENAKCFNTLLNDSLAGMYDGVIHAGDIAYDLHHNCGTVGDKFLKMMEPIGSRVPYMVCPGNHERHGEYYQYKERFSMPGNSSGMYYSWNMGPIHFVTFNSDFYMKAKFKTELVEQYNWLEQDLEEAQKDRDKRPWIIVYGHHPFYRSNHATCSTQDSPSRITRPKINGQRVDSLEKLFMKAGVDLIFWGHAHFYERLWPVYDYKILNGSLDKPYTNPKAPVQIVTGSAGNKDKLSTFMAEMCEWSGFRVQDYGFSRLRVENRTHLYLEHILVDGINSGKVVDSIWLVREHHGPYELPQPRVDY